MHQNNVLAAYGLAPHTGWASDSGPEDGGVWGDVGGSDDEEEEMEDEKNFFLWATEKQKSQLRYVVSKDDREWYRGKMAEISAELLRRSTSKAETAANAETGTVSLPRVDRAKISKRKKGRKSPEKKRKRGCGREIGGAV